MDYIVERFVFPKDKGGKSGKIIYELEQGVIEEDVVEAKHKVTKKHKVYTFSKGRLSPQYQSMYEN